MTRSKLLPFSASFAALTIFATTNFGCEMSQKSWPNLMIMLMDPAAEQLWLHLPDAPDATVIVKFVDKTLDETGIKTEKRIRVVAGHPIIYEQLKDHKNSHNLMRYKSARGAFDGYFDMDYDDLVQESKFIAPKPDGLNMLVSTKYKEPRPLSDALDDTVCALNQVPVLLAQEG